MQVIGLLIWAFVPARVARRPVFSQASRGSRLQVPARGDRLPTLRLHGGWGLIPSRTALRPNVAKVQEIQDIDSDQSKPPGSGPPRFRANGGEKTIAITGIATTMGDDIVTTTPTGSCSVNADAGTNTRVLNYSTLSADILYQDAGFGWFRSTNEVRSSLTFVTFENFNITIGSGDDVLVGRDNNDTLNGGVGSDQITSGLGAHVINHGAGIDHWTADHSTLGVAVTADASDQRCGHHRRTRRTGQRDRGHHPDDRRRG